MLSIFRNKDEYNPIQQLLNPDEDYDCNDEEPVDDLDEDDFNEYDDEDDEDDYLGDAYEEDEDEEEDDDKELG